jgi:hypothetical protein
MVNERKSEVYHIVEAAVSQLKGLEQAVRDGTITAADARKRAADLIHATRFDGTNYLFVYAEGVIALHGTRRDLEGSDALERKDAYGTFYAR